MSIQLRPQKIIDTSRNQLITTKKQLSNLAHPIIKLEGHEREILTARFSHDGAYLATGGFDMNLNLWKLGPEIENLTIKNCHSKAIIQLCWSKSDEMIYTCSADYSCCVWDIESGSRLKKISHLGIVNAVCGSKRGSEMVASGSDDGFLKVWDIRLKSSIAEYDNTNAVTSLEFGKDSNLIFCGDSLGQIKVSL